MLPVIIFLYLKIYSLVFPFLIGVYLLYNVVLVVVKVSWLWIRSAFLYMCMHVFSFNTSVVFSLSYLFIKPELNMSYSIKDAFLNKHLYVNLQNLSIEQLINPTWLFLDWYSHSLVFLLSYRITSQMDRAVKWINETYRSTEENINAPQAKSHYQDLITARDLPLYTISTIVSLTFSVHIFFF